MKLKEKLAVLSYSDAVTSILEWFLHLTIGFRVASLMFSVKES